jgi:hypothetical protein
MRLPASFRDPSGFLFARDGVLFRQINSIYQDHYRQLLDSGLYDLLVEKRKLIPHVEVGVSPALPRDAYCVIQPEGIPFVSYPYEWSFSQLKDSALTTLAIQKLALRHGMSLKDASAYNIQFLQCEPLLIDTLSFEKLEPGRPWIAYRQFCQHFLAPLALMSYRDVRLNQLSRVYIDGLPLDLTSHLLPFRTRLSFGLLSHIHLHAAAQKRYAGQPLDQKNNGRKMGQTALLGLIDSLETTIRKLRWNPAGTDWVNYESEHNYSATAGSHKEALVRQYLEQVRPEGVWDLGANVGRFSRLAVQMNIPTVALDLDPAAVERSYLTVKENSESQLLPIVLDLTNPSAAIGWANNERLSLVQRGPVGLVMALALVHHLAIGNNVPVASIADFFASLSPWLIVEFVPKEDLQVQRLLAARDDIFPDYDQSGFEGAFNQRYTIVSRDPIRESRRLLYLMRRQEGA